jgi:chromosome partitioning protein
VRIDDFQANMAKARRGYHSLDEYQSQLNQKRRTFQRYLRDNYNYVLLDCPPSLTLQVKQFLRIADGIIVPSVPDRLSVRGTLWLLDRLRAKNFTRAAPIGTLWSLFRSQSSVHASVVEQARKRKEPLDQLPLPFKTVIPNASKIAESTNPDQRPTSFSAKYTPKFAGLYQQLCREIRRRVPPPRDL